MSTRSTSVEPEQRFHVITSPCECVEDYRPGGYHPVHIGDIIKDGQYKIIRKLGDGSYSTVWLAHDLRNRSYPAIKILVSQLSGPTSEISILRHIKESDSTRSSQYLTQLLDEFEHHGPNGIHACLVLEAMGPSVNTMVEELPQFKPRTWGMTIRYPYWMAKSILKQSLQALRYLHSRGIAHGDFQPGNMLFCLNGIDTQTEEVLQQPLDTDTGSISPLVQRLDGQQDLSAPRYLCIAQPLVLYSSPNPGFKIKLSDMGGTYFLADPPKKVVTPYGLRAPELILTGVVDKSLDVWSFGCLVFELITGQPLFCVPYSQFEDDDHLLQLSARLGPLPDHLFKRWTNSSMYYTPERALYNCQLGGVREGEEPLLVEQTSMEDLFDQAEPELSQEDASMAKELVRAILQYDPTTRPTAEDVLRHPFFN